MNTENFISKIAAYVQKYAPDYNICVYSPIIAQAILESAYGTSELAVNAHNYFGLKYRQNRCPTACGIYYKIGSEQNTDGTYTSSAMQWMKFPDMESGVKGYFDFINISNYQNLKGVTDPKTYLEAIKSDGYATSTKYVQNLLNVIERYDLTKYDASPDKGTKDVKMRFNVHAGHNPDGKVACGAIGFISESTEARNVKNSVISLLKSLGHTVYDCTVDNGSSQTDVLQKIVSKCNAHEADLDLSLHFNAGANRLSDKKSTGTEAYIYSSASKAKNYAQKILDNLSSLGLRNRGVKTSKTLYFLRKTKNPALLIEILFCDDPDDTAIYHPETIAQAIVKGITDVINESA